MHHFFGSSKKTPTVDVNKTVENVGKRADLVDVKIKKIEDDLILLKKQLEKAKSPSEKTRIKQRCMQLLKQKKMYEQQRDSLFNQQMNLEQTSFMTNQLKDNMDTIQVMKETTNTFKTQLKQMSIEKIEDLQDELQEMMMDSNEINELMGRNYATPDIDESDLLDELDSLESEIQEENKEKEKGSSYLDELDEPEETTKQKVSLQN